MGTQGGPNIEEGGLVFAVDAANPKSYISGDTTCNSLVSSNVGTIINTGPVDRFWDPSKGGSWVFDGTDDVINFGNFLSLSTEVTVIAWVKVDTWALYETFVSQIDSFLLNQSSNTTPGSLYFAIYDSGGNFKQITNYGVAPVSGWFHYAGVADGSWVRMYVDGVSVGTPVPYDGTIKPNTDDVCVGGRANNTYMLDGSVANTLIYTRGLSASEILQNYNALKSRFV